MHDEAIADFTRVLALDPGNANAFFNRCVLRPASYCGVLARGVSPDTHIRQPSLARAEELRMTLLATWRQHWLTTAARWRLTRSRGHDSSPSIMCSF